MRFARWTFVLAGVYGVLVVAPLYFLEATISREQPPPISLEIFRSCATGSLLIFGPCRRIFRPFHGRIENQPF